MDPLTDQKNSRNQRLKKRRFDEDDESMVNSNSESESDMEADDNSSTANRSTVDSASLIDFDEKCSATNDSVVNSASPLIDLAFNWKFLITLKKDHVINWEKLKEFVSLVDKNKWYFLELLLEKSSDCKNFYETIGITPKNTNALSGGGKDRLRKFIWNLRRLEITLAIIFSKRDEKILKRNGTLDLDTFYLGLKYEITLLKTKDKDFCHLEKFVENTLDCSYAEHHSLKLFYAYRLNRRKPQNQESETGRKKSLLAHGCCLRRCGSILGNDTETLTLTNSIGKAIRYCFKPHYREVANWLKATIILCEVDIDEITKPSDDSSYGYTFHEGRWSPNPDYEVKLDSGVYLKTGPLLERSEKVERTFDCYKFMNKSQNELFIRFRERVIELKSEEGAEQEKKRKQEGNKEDGLNCK